MGTMPGGIGRRSAEEDPKLREATWRAKEGELVFQLQVGTYLQANQVRDLVFLSVYMSPGLSVARSLDLSAVSRSQLAGCAQLLEQHAMTLLSQLRHTAFATRLTTLSRIITITGA
eukprot:3874371-Rhodomonas_salina.3